MSWARGLTPPSEKLNIAGVGIGGQGGGVLNDMKSQNIVALCDVDWTKASGTFRAFPNAERFKDYRVMLEKRKDIEAVMVATPDHMHAPIGLAAMRAGKHVYVEKPMAHTIEEARLMAKVAKETGLVTQMGNNGHAGEGAAPHARMDPGRRHRDGSRGAWMERPAGQLVEAAGSTPGRGDAGSRGVELGSVAGSGARAPVSQGLPPVPVAGLV